MKTVQDWGFISKEQGAVKPKLQDNKIFHALTSAYENTQQQEIYGATENIVRREKELCELALADLKKLAEGNAEDGTLKLIMDHYHSRLAVAKEKEEKINHLSEDSRKMSEEYKKKTQELAEVKRSLMESQTKLRDLAKSTEKLLKREEELRFIESNLRTEIDKNKRNIINGLYEIVADLPDGSEPGSHRLPLAEAARPVTPPIAADPAPAPRPPETKPSYPEGLFRSVPESPLKAKPTQDSVWVREEPEAAAPPKAVAPYASSTQVAHLAKEEPAEPLPPGPVILKPGDLYEKSVRLKVFEPGKSICAKSMVKTADGEVISEYFYSPLQAKETRSYVFNALYGISSLLALKSKDVEAFNDRLETLFTDLLSRLDHGRNIHLESFLSEEINQDIIAHMLSLSRKERPDYFDWMATRLLARIEAVGPARAGLVEQQFRNLPKPTFPPNQGLAA